MENIKEENNSILQTVLLSLLPGLLVLVFFVIIGPYSSNLGIPSLLVILIAIPLIIVPFELGYLIYQGKRINGRLSLRNVVLFREKTPLWQYIILIIFLLLWTTYVFRFVSFKVDTYFISNFFYRLPNWFYISKSLQNISQYSKTVLIVTWVFGFVFNGVIGPIVEELYFRGYLLPRLRQTKRWAPVINVILFSFYHFFTPWQNVTRIIVLLPMVYVVWWKRNIYIGIITHCMLNMVGMLGILPLILKA